MSYSKLLIFASLCFTCSLNANVLEPFQDHINKCNMTLAKLNLPSNEITKKLEGLLKPGVTVISKTMAATLTKKLKISPNQLMMELVPIAQKMALPPISNYFVGVVGRAVKSGNLIMGVNLEFPGFALNQTVHGEQFLIARAFSLGEVGIEAIALSGPPCGHCRQFLNETDGSQNMKIFVPGDEGQTLPFYLPNAFGPRDLGFESGLLNSPVNTQLKFSTRDSLLKNAFNAAKKSYAPYSGNMAGVALQMKSGEIFVGSYLENAAFNPSLSPLQVALVNLIASGGKYEDIQKAALFETERPKGNSSSQFETTKALLHAIAPNATLITKKLIL